MASRNRNRMVVEPQPHRIGQYELPHSGLSGEFSADHTTHGMAYDMYRLQVQGIEQVVVVDHHVKHVINMLNARARLKARMRRGIDREVFSKLDQKGIPATQATSPMEKEQGRTAAVGAELGLEHTVTDGDRFFLHAIPSLCMSSQSNYTYLSMASAYLAHRALSTFLRVLNCGMVAPCQLT